METGGKIVRECGLICRHDCRGLVHANRCRAKSAPEESENEREKSFKLILPQWSMAALKRRVYEMITATLRPTSGSFHGESLLVGLVSLKSRKTAAFVCWWFFDSLSLSEWSSNIGHVRRPLECSHCSFCGIVRIDFYRGILHFHFGSA